MSYVGDSALSDDFRQRVNNVFRQTIELAEEGMTGAVLLGCDYILRLDSQFEPARRLQQQTQNDELVNAADLRALAGLDDPCEPRTEKVDHPQPQGSERRRLQRMRFVTEVEVSGLGMVRSTDLTCAGIYLETLQRFPEGTALGLRFRLEPTDEHPMELRSRVLYTHENIGFGVGFEHLQAEFKKRIEDFIAARIGS